MNRQKHNTKNAVLASLFLILFLISQIQIIGNLNQLGNTNENDDLLENEFDNIPETSDLNLTDYIKGSGANQTVRVYMVNKSFSQGKNQFFEIDAPADNTYLSYGDFNFTFQNNYTTDYILEDDDTLYDSDVIDEYQFNTDEDYSSIIYESGTNLTEVSLNNLTDGNGLDSYFILNSTNGEINFTISASFNDIDPGAYIDFIRTNILAFILNTTYNVSKDANLTLRIKNFYSDSWKNIVDNIEINSSLGPHDLDQLIINENLNHIYNFTKTIKDYGNYTGTYTFDGEIGETGIAITFVNYTSGGGGTPIISNNLDGHDTILTLDDISDSDYIAAYTNLSANNQSYGSFEFWYRTNDTRKENAIELIGDNNSIQTIFINNSEWWYYNGTGKPELIPNVNAPANDTWMLITIDFRCHEADTYLTLAQREFSIEIDGVSSGDLTFKNSSLFNINKQLQIIGFNTKITDNTAKVQQNIDAIGYDWNPNYTLGDNLYPIGGYLDDMARLPNHCELQFIFNRTDTSVFNATIHDFDFRSFISFDLDITNSSYVALEFDLKGKKSTVNGFYAWIRTMDLDLAKYAELNISLYRANKTIKRTQENLNKEAMDPDKNEMIDTFIKDYDDYHGDQLTYFQFNTLNTTDLELNNYFIVIKSNVSDVVFKLVVFPSFKDDKGTEHQLRTTTNNGDDWDFASSTQGGASSGYIDANQFKINVTRGYMPSDFKIDGEISLQIQNVTLEDYNINSYPYNDSSVLKWGLGRWNSQNFPVAIANDTNNKFRVDLTWNDTIVNDFIFNVTYLVLAYRVENATSSYNVTYNSVPEWTLNYTLNLAHTKFTNWNLSSLAFIYPEYYSATHLYTPDHEEVFDDTAGEKEFEENKNYKDLIVSTSIINISDVSGASGNYSLRLISPDSILKMYSYINFNGSLWETLGFMYGDNISVSLDIQDHRFKSPNNGIAKVCLFYPNNTKYPGAELISNSGNTTELLDEKSIWSYSFKNHTIINLTDSLPVEGKYKLGYFWTNGSAIGCKSIEIYIDSYDIQIQDCKYTPIKNENLLEGTILHKVLNNYSILFASVNETTGISRPNYYHINKSVSVNDGLFSYKENGLDLEVFLSEFLQNETVLNPNELLTIKTTIQNRQPILDLNVKIGVKLVSIANEEWIIAQGESTTKKLKTLGDPQDTDEFQVNITIPNLQADNIWKGVNAPIRKAGAKTIVTIYIEEKVAGTYSSNDFSVIINQTDDEFEGQILALKQRYEVTPKAILKGFERDECLYLPDNTTFIINIFDRNFISSYDQFLESYGLKFDSKFINITANPDELINGLPIEISTVLTTEFGDLIENKMVTLQYNESGTWINIDSKLTNTKGSLTFEVDTLDIDTQDILQFRFVWSGDLYILSNSTQFEVDIIIQKNQMNIRSLNDDDVIHRNENVALIFKIENTGNSNLEITDIDVELSEDIDYSIKEINYILYKRLAPGETLTIKIEFEVQDIEDDELKVIIKIKATNIISGEKIVEDKKINLIVLDKPLENYAIDYFIVIIIAAFSILWILALLFARGVVKTIAAPVEKEPTKKRPRKGRYLKVSEIEKEKETIIKPGEKVEKQTAEGKKIEKKKITDLDALLEEKGLDDKKKGKK